MRNLLIAILLVISHVVSAQSIDQLIDSKIRAAEARQKAYADSLFNVKKPGIPKCESGPTVASISSITQTSLTARITGDGFSRIAVSIFDEDSTREYYTTTTQPSAELAIQFPTLQPGKYRLYASAINCSGFGSRAFTIKAPEGGKPDCPRGPTLTSIRQPTPTSLVFQFDGEGVYSIDYEIKDAAGKSLFTGNVEPKSSLVTASGFLLADGEYQLYIKGASCNRKPDQDSSPRSFTIKSSTGDNGTSNPPPADKSAKFELIMGTTGSGFQADQPYGIDPQWIERIEAFKYSWGYGITGICLWIPWDAYEKTPGVYEVAALRRAIQYCKDRGLGFSVAFMARRHQGDGFIREDEIITGSAGDKYYEGPAGAGGIYPGYANERVHALMSGAIKSIATEMKKYDKSFYVALAGGGAGEQVNYVWGRNGVRQVADFSEDNLNRFNEWRSKRGLAGPGRPPVIQGPGIDWPHPDYNNPIGLEFGRWTTYGIYKAYKAMVDAVKSVSDFPCLYFYSVTSNSQFRAIQNPNLNFIASPGDGMYGSDGTGVYDLGAKVKVNSVNLGTFPNGISATEVDPEDLTPYQGAGTPPYCYGSLNYQAFLDLSRTLFSRGLRIMHFAMAFCPQEIRDFEPVLKVLHKEYLNKPYVRPVVNASNTKTVEVTEKYRRSEDLMEGIDPYKWYTKYTDDQFWGPIRPDANTGSTGGSGSSGGSKKVNDYLDSNLGVYLGNVSVEVKKPSGTVYSYSKGSIGRDEPKSVMSISKGVTAATLLTFYDEGKLGIDDKVSKYIPSWDRSDKRGITVRQVVSHTSGIKDETTYDGSRTLSEAVDWMANTPLDFTPGTRFKYSTTSYQVLARIAEVIAGKNWEQIFNERIRYKCNMNNAVFNPAYVPVTGNPNNPLAGYGLYASLNDLSNFAEMLRDNGVFRGNRVLSSKAMSLLRTDMTGGYGNWGFGFILEDEGLVSESARGLSLYAGNGLSYALMTQSNYETTIGVNNGLRKLILQTL